MPEKRLASDHQEIEFFFWLTIFPRISAHVLIGALLRISAHSLDHNTHQTSAPLESLPHEKQQQQLNSGLCVQRNIYI